MVRPERPSHTLKIISASVRGLRTNIGDLTHNCVLRHSADVVVVTETWLNNEVEPTFGKIHGYTQWNRRDRLERAGGDVAVCFKEGVQAQHLDVVPPPHMEVNFAPEKTQAMVVSRSPAAGPAVERRLRFGGVPLPLQEAAKVLGVEVDRELRFDGHIKHIAKKASHRVSALRRVASFLDRGGKLLLYKAQIRPYLEYAALSRMSCAASHTRRLDSIQRRALRLLDAADPPDPPDPPAQFEPVSPLDSRENRRDVAALVDSTRPTGAGKSANLAGYDSLRNPPREARERFTQWVQWGFAAPFPVPPSTNALWGPPRGLQDVELFFTAAVPPSRRLNTQSVKLGGKSVETFRSPPAEASEL
ncbi:hypothetical protein GWK47_044120 [Chionoecetes opilio]|uniref:Uncharacterized protein n=1 Tax=Chionoecetes opilio TaxID=41210 RepID=A0A8J4YG82_CHIOP|nr:hypothetical protein GWK47_044120 [Chionoecetes opilio]